VTSHLHTQLEKSTATLMQASLIIVPIANLRLPTLSLFVFKIAFITGNSSLEHLLEGLFAQINVNLS